MERLALSAREMADLELIANGALSPLDGFMDQESYQAVCEELRLPNGLPWALPVCLAVDSLPKGSLVTLGDRSGDLYATMEIYSAFRYDKEKEAALCFGTTDPKHPGVARLYQQPDHYISGPVTFFKHPTPPFPDLALDPAETRQIFAARGWKTVTGFQTRNPIHRAHEYLTKAALEITDGLLIHPLVGETKEDDIPAAVRVACYQTLIDNYYPQSRVLLAAFPAAMRYAGPREALWHAICRKNYGCSHFIVGRDHAGVGNYYGSYDAQQIFDRFSAKELGITILRFDNAFFCRRCETVATAKTCPHSDEAHLLLSGTSVRQMLTQGVALPKEFSRPEVEAILRTAYS